MDDRVIIPNDAAALQAAGSAPADGLRTPKILSDATQYTVLAGFGLYVLGFIIADLPPEEAREVNSSALERGLDPILIMAPNNSPRRLSEIARQASGFVYCVARKGVTGKRTDLSQGVAAFLSRCRAATNLPLALGFGIKTQEDVRGVRGLADIAIVGTACLEAWERGGSKGYREFLHGLAKETH